MQLQTNFRDTDTGLVLLIAFMSVFYSLHEIVIA